MENNEQLKVTDIRVGDKVRDKRTGFEFIITSIFWSLHCSPTEATIYVDFKENEGDPFEYELQELELIEEGDEL